MDFSMDFFNPLNRHPDADAYLLSVSHGFYQNVSIDDLRSLSPLTSSRSQTRSQSVTTELEFDRVLRQEGEEVDARGPSESQCIDAYLDGPLGP